MQRVCASVLIALLAGCNQSPLIPVPPVLGLPRPGVVLTATPDRALSCDASDLRIHFDWHVSHQRATRRYELRVDSPIGALLANQERDGHANSGSWVHAGQWFFLVDGDNREVVAALRIAAPEGCD